MSLVTLSPIAGAGWQFFDNSGIPLSGGKIYVYQSGTQTPVTTYTSSAGNIPHSFPIVLDSSGRVSEQIWVEYVGSLKFVLNTSTNTLIWTKDNIPTANASAILYNEGSANAVTRTVQSKLQEIVSIQDFGAIGNGSTSAVTAILNADTASNQILIPAGTYLIDSNLTLSSSIVVESGAQFSISNGIFLYIDGPFNAPTATCFSGAGQVVFGNNSTQEVFPEWWGAVAVPSQNSSSVLQTPNDCTAAINSAIRSIRFNWQPSGKAVKFGIGVYGVSSIQIITTSLYGNGLTLRGTRSTQLSGASAVNTGAGGASVLQSVSASAYLVNLDATTGGYVHEIHFEDLVFDGKCQKDSVFLMSPGSLGPTYTVNFIYFDRCVWHNVKDTKSLISSNTSNVASENALIYFNQCSFLLNSALQGTNTGVAVLLQNPGAWQWQFHQCYFSGTSTTNFATIYVQTGGVELQSCYFEANSNYDVGCLDGGWVHVHDCQTDSNKFAFFGTYGGGTNYTSNRGIIIENLVCKQATNSWTIISDSATQNLTLRGLFGGGVYLRSGAGNAFIENVVGGNVEFGDRSNAANTYTGKATLVNVPGVNTIAAANTTPIGGLTIVEGTNSAVLNQTIALDLISYFSLAHSSGLEAFILSSFKQGVGYRDLYFRTRNTYLDAGGLQMLVAGDGPVVTTPDGTKKYKISVDNAGAVITTLIP